MGEVGVNAAKALKYTPGLTLEFDLVLDVEKAVDHEVGSNPADTRERRRA